MLTAMDSMMPTRSVLLLLLYWFHAVIQTLGTASCDSLHCHEPPHYLLMMLAIC